MQSFATGIDGPCKGLKNEIKSTRNSSDVIHPSIHQSIDPSIHQSPHIHRFIPCHLSSLVASYCSIIPCLFCPSAKSSMGDRPALVWERDRIRLLFQLHRVYPTYVGFRNLVDKHTKGTLSRLTQTHTHVFRRSPGAVMA